jgi:predicted site-specific integrase-resolvase
MERRFLSVEEVAASLSVHQNTVRRWVREGSVCPRTNSGDSTGWMPTRSQSF